MGKKRKRKYAAGEEEKDNFGITLWGRVEYEKTRAAKSAANVIARNREFLTTSLKIKLYIYLMILGDV